MEQGPVKLSVQTFGLLQTPTLAGLVPVLGPTLLHPPAHTCPTSNMMMYFWVSTGEQSGGLLNMGVHVRRDVCFRTCFRPLVNPEPHKLDEFDCLWRCASRMHEQS